MTIDPRIKQYTLNEMSDLTNATSYTLSIDPTPGRLVLATVINSRLADVTEPTLSGNNLTWVKIDTVVVASIRITLFRALGPAPSSGNLTADFGGVTQINCYMSASEFANVAVGGTNGSQAIAQSISGSETSSTSLNLAFASGPSGNRNAVFFTFGASSSNPISRTESFIIIAGGTHAESKAWLQVWRPSFATDITAAVSPASEFCGIGVELQASPDDIENRARVTIGNEQGVVIAELEPEMGPVSWRLNDIGRASFALPRGDEKTIEYILRFGNRIFIEFDNGLPAWGGTIEPPRIWTRGRVEINAFSAEHILSLRRTGKNRIFQGATAGDIFAALIREANQEWDTGIIPNDIWTGGPTYDITFNFTDLLTAIRTDLCGKLAGTEFAIRPQLAGGKIYFTADLWSERGIDRPNTVLVEGTNTSSEGLAEYGPLLTQHDIAGSGNGWGDDRLTSQARDQDAIGLYGLRQGAGVFGDIGTQETLDAQAAQLLQETTEPTVVVSVTAHNRDPGRFEEYDIGDRIRLMLNSYGFEGFYRTVRVHTREFTPAGSCNLVIEAGAEIPVVEQDEVPVFDPLTDVTSAAVEIWLDADDIDTLFQDTARTTAVTADGDPVGGWEDKSGNGHHAEQATTANKGTYKTPVANGRGVVRFDGVTDAMSYVVNITAQMNLFIVVKFNTTGPFDPIFSWDYSNTTVTQFNSTRMEVNDLAYGGSIDTTTFHVWEINWFKSAGAANALRQDGADAVTSYRTNGLESGGGNTIAAAPGPYYGDLDLCEILGFDAELSAGDRTAVEEYLQAKWGTP